MKEDTQHIVQIVIIVLIIAMLAWVAGNWIYKIVQPASEYQKEKLCIDYEFPCDLYTNDNKKICYYNCTYEKKDGVFNYTIDTCKIAKCAVRIDAEVLKK